MGADGAVPVSANIIPNLIVNLYKSFRMGKMEEAKKIQYKIIPIIDICELPSFPAEIKDALNVLGKKVGQVRKPILPLTEQNKKKVRQMINNFFNYL